MSTRIYIPTRGRVGFNRQVTLREFLAKSSHKPVLVCPPNEVRAHRAYHPRVLGCPRVGIGPTRQWIMEESGADVCVVASDDLRFSWRPNPGPGGALEICDDLDPMIALIEQAVAAGFPHGGVGARQGNNRKHDGGPRSTGHRRWGALWVECERVNDFHFFNRKVAISYARWDALPVMEDFHFTLTMLLAGLPNLVLHSYVWNQQGSDSSGGCSLYRTAAVQAAGARGLAEAYPDYVKVVEKTSKETSTSWKNFKTRLDVIVYWWKAWQAGGGKVPQAGLQVPA